MASQFDLVTFIDDHLWIILCIGASIFLYITYFLFKMTVNKLELNDNFPKEKLQFLAKLDKKEKKAPQKALKKKGKNKKNVLGKVTDEQNGENGDDSASTTTTTVSESVDLNKEAGPKSSPANDIKQKAVPEGQNKQKPAKQVEKKSSPAVERKQKPASEVESKSALNKESERKPSPVPEVEKKLASEVESKPKAAPEVETKNNKKKNKGKKAEAEKKENTPPQSIEEPSKVHEIIEKHHVHLEEAGLQQSTAPPTQEKSRKKRDAQEPEDDNGMKNLQNKLRDNEKKIQNKDSEISKLKAELIKVQKEAAENQSQSVSFAQQLKITQEALHDACQPKSNPEFEKLGKENFDLKARLQAATQHAKEVETLKAQLAEARKPNPELEKLRKEQSDLKARLQAASEQAKQVETLKAQLSEARQPKRNDELEKLRKENSDLKARLQDTTELAKQVGILKAELAETKNAPSQPAVDPAIQKHVVELEEKLRHAEKNSAETDQIVQTLKNENKHLHDREQQISAELDALNREIDQLQNIRIEKENIVQQASNNTEELNKLKREIDELEKKNEQYNGSITKLNIELKKACTETIEHKKDRDEMKKKVETLIAEKEELSNLVDSNEKKIADFTDYYNETSSKIRELQNTMNSMELEKNDLKMQLSEERERVEELEQSNSVKATNNDSSKVKELEAKVEKLTQKKNELYELTMNLGEKVRAAESQAEKVLKDYGRVNGESFEKAAEVIAKSLKSLNVKISEVIPKTHEEFNEWAQGLPEALKKLMNVEKPAATTSVEKSTAVKSSPSRDNDEIKKLKEDVKRYEHSIDLLVNQLHAIEAAYAEREAELKAEINALEQTERS
jgi:chromosome segregation ATPase